MTVRQNSLGFIAASFLGWGLLRALNDILVAAHQMRSPNHDAEAMLVPFSFFVAYLLVPIPASRLIRQFGLRTGLAGATGIMGAAALWYGIDGQHSSQIVCFACIFAIAAGIAALQTAGNPGVMLLGPPATGARRLLGAQAILALGSALAPFFVALVHSRLRPDPAVMLARAREVYLAAGVLLICVALVFTFRRQDGLERGPATASAGKIPVSLRTPMIFALIAIFLFVGTEATVITHIIGYRLNFSSRVAPPVLPWAGTLTVYWLIVMGGRLLSYTVLKRSNLIGLLQGAAFLGVFLLSVALFWRGNVGLVALLGTGLVNAAIFPLVFCSITESLNEQQMATASGWLMTAMCGGALTPLISGVMADHLGFRAAFVVPALSYLWIACTASRCRGKLPVQLPEFEEAACCAAPVSL